MKTSADSEKAEWMKNALDLARLAAEEDEVPVGAIVLQGGSIIGRGYNRRETWQDPLAHAEILAIEEASRFLKSWRLIDCTLVVTLEPCMMCLAAAQQARIKELVFGALDPKGGALSLGYTFHQDQRTNHRFSVEYHKTPECSLILKEFFSKKRKGLSSLNE